MPTSQWLFMQCDECREIFHEWRLCNSGGMMIALLPMKGNSERVPGKNVRLLADIPLFFHIANMLRSTELVSRLVINTDNSEIADLASRQYGDWVTIHWRWDEVIGDHVSMNKVIEQDVRMLGPRHDYIQLHATSPFLRRETVEAAIQTFQQGYSDRELDSVFGVSLIKARLFDGELRPLNHDPTQLIRTQDLPEIYEENSAFYIFNGGVFLKTGNRIGLRPKPLVMSRSSIEVLDIDEEEDWALAQMIKSRHLR